MFEKLKQIHKDQESEIVSKERFIKNLQSQQVVSDTIITAASSIIKYLEGKVTKTEVLNQIEGFATSEDVRNIASMLQNLDKTIQSTKPNEKLVVDAINALKRETIAIPSKIKIEKTEKVAVSNLKDIKPDNSDVVKAIKDKKLEVNVEAPIINTEKADFSLIEQILNNLLQETKKKELKVPDKFKITNLKEIKPTDTKKIEDKLEKGNKYLKEISEKKFGGGSTGGLATPFVDQNDIPAFPKLNASGELPVSLGSDEVNVNIDMATEGIATEATLAKTVGIALPEYDSITATYNDGTFTETYVYKLGVTTVATITVIFVDATKKKLVSIVRT